MRRFALAALAAFAMTTMASAEEAADRGPEPPLEPTRGTLLPPGRTPVINRDLPRGLNGRTLSTSRTDPSDPQQRWDDLRRYGPAGAWLFRDPRFQNVLPPCDDGNQLEKIQRTFAEKERRFWDSRLEIVTFDRIRVTITNPWGQDNIPRRYCVARAHLSDGRVRTVDYAIMEDQGIIGHTYGVEWCVRGLDRGRSFDPACRMARP